MRVTFTGVVLKQEEPARNYNCVCCVVCVRKAIPCQMIFWGTISDIPPPTGLLHPGRDTISLIQATLVAFLSVTKVSKLRR